jgi:protein-disulfide isomerase
MEKGNTLTVPIAIIAAGVLIAGAIFFSNKTPGNNIAGPNGAGSTEIPVKAIPINPVTEKDYIRGNPNAKVVIVEFSDTECPFCKRFHLTMKSLVDKYGMDGTVAWVYRNFPIKELHVKAPKESEALLCAGKVGGQKGFWDYTDRLYETTPSNDGLDSAQLPVIARAVGLDVTAFNTCLNSGEMAERVESERTDSLNSGGSGTPFSVFIAKEAFDKDTVEKFLLDSALRYRFPLELMTISDDNTKVAVSGAMPIELLEGLVSAMTNK